MPAEIGCSVSAEEKNKYSGTAPSPHHCIKRDSMPEVLVIAIAHYINSKKPKTCHWILLKYLGMENWRLFHCKSSNCQFHFMQNPNMLLSVRAFHLSLVDIA